ncbi:MAG TPA: LPXTG cell wall anchor domain-containing protein [Thermoanaerobaculia bacterium]|nr:LPXTG cell wall anchor domain-containing protein [Thermoanaerobaculia bacterium]
MPKPLRLITLVLAVGAFAAVAQAQNADYNTGGPTANTLQLKLVEPAEGAMITGNQVRVGVSYNTHNFGEGQGTKFGEANFPQPTFDIFLDNDLRKTVKGTEANVVFLDNVPAGAHKIVVMAKNVSGEVIDRKQVNITTAAAVAEAPPAPATTTYEARTAPPPPPAPVIEAPAPPPPPAPAPMERETLPKTASSYPTLAVAGIALAAVGLSLGRKVS